MKKNVLINLRVEQDLKESFQQIAENNGYTMSEVITAYMKNVVRRGALPSRSSAKSPTKHNSILSIPEIKFALENAVFQLDNKESIKSISIFGSYAIGSMDSNSDIDLLIDADSNFGFKGMGMLCDILEKSLHKKIDITLDQHEDSYFYRVANREKIIIYQKK